MYNTNHWSNKATGKTKASNMKTINMKLAHKIAKTFEGDYVACLTLAMKILHRENEMSAENIKVDEIHSADYVLFNCEYYNLPDNTRGEIGYHSTYRPLCGDMYKGNELVTDLMQNDLRDFYKKEKEKKEERKAELANNKRRMNKEDIDAMATRNGSGVFELDNRNF